MSDLKLRRGVIASLVCGAVLVGITAGLYAGRVIARTRPTCANAVDTYFAVMPERQRYMFEQHFSGRFGRDARVRLCREGRWSEAMKRCWAGAASLDEIDACPNEWLNGAAPTANMFSISCM